MADTTFSDLDPAVSIDPVTDWLGIDQSTATNKINRNTLLGIIGTPVGTSDVQSIGNKTIGVSNTVSLLDTLFTLNDNSDPTKQAQFQLSGITTSTTRTYILPNASSTLADISTAQTFTNKTLTAPVVTGGSITNSTISVDSIAEFTSGNGVTVDGLNIKDGKLNTSSSVVASNITDSAVTPAKLLAGTGTSWTWQTWSPSYSNLTVGSGTVTAQYAQIGKTIIVQYIFLLGGGSAVGTGPTVSLPVTAASNYGSDITIVGNGFGQDTGTAGYALVVELRQSTSVFTWEAQGAGGTYVTTTGLTASIPYTFTSGDKLTAFFVYQAA